MLIYIKVKVFVGNIKIDQSLDSTGYFARPFASWERGSKKNFNGLMLQYAPEKRLMNTVDEDEITINKTD